MKKELLKQEFCTEKWDKMSPTSSGKHCSECKADLTDLSHVPIGELVEDHLGSNRCVRLTNTQIDFLSFYNRLGKTAVISSIVVSSVFLNNSYAQTMEKAQSEKDSCLITGRAFYNDSRKEPSRYATILITVGKVTYETKTDLDGNFALNLPKNTTVFYSNVKKLESKKIKNRETIRLGKIKISREQRRMGWL